ncbi:hypothetical protein COOONC_23339 [Cooperia oncophora]
MWRGRGDGVLHIGFHNELLDCFLLNVCNVCIFRQVRAWDPRKPLYFAPAMNTMMWENPPEKIS